jgi:uncharacterized protein (TIGR03083 family)
MEQLHRARSEFERRVSEVRSEHMALPTPCSEWTVRQLLAHVIGGDYAYIELLHGGSAEQAFFLPTNYEVGNYPLEQFQRSAAELIAAFSESGALDRTVQHPIGELPAMRLLGMRARMAPRVKTLAATGYFLPPAGLSDTAPVQDRLLDLLGRHPSSPPASYSERA